MWGLGCGPGRMEVVGLVGYETPDDRRPDRWGLGCVGMGVGGELG